MIDIRKNSKYSGFVSETKFRSVKELNIQEKRRNFPMYRNQQLMILEILIAFDVWLLIKARWLLRTLADWVLPLVKVLFFMSIGAGFLSTYILACTRFDIVNGNRKLLNAEENSSIKEQLLDDKFRSEAVAVQKELIKIKYEDSRLENSLHRMNLRLISLYERQSNNVKSLADFASEAVGGLVLATPGTESYSKETSMQISLFGVPIWRSNNHTPRKVIQSWTEPGECWAFRGSHGKIEIELAHRILIDQITLEHIPRSASITGSIDTAPKSFNLLGKTKEQYIMIDTFTYNDKGLPSQTFKITKEELKKIPFKRVIFEVISNWGNPNYTCIYRFRVHGKIYKSSNINEENFNIE